MRLASREQPHARCRDGGPRHLGRGDGAHLVGEGPVERRPQGHADGHGDDEDDDDREAHLPVDDRPERAAGEAERPQHREIGPPAAHSHQGLVAEGGDREHRCEQTDEEGDRPHPVEVGDDGGGRLASDALARGRPSDARPGVRGRSRHEADDRDRRLGLHAQRGRGGRVDGAAVAVELDPTGGVGDDEAGDLEPSLRFLSLHHDRVADADVEVPRRDPTESAICPAPAGSRPLSTIGPRSPFSCCTTTSWSDTSSACAVPDP